MNNLERQLYSMGYGRFLKVFSLFVCSACRILVPKPRIVLMLPAMEVQSLDHWATREILLLEDLSWGEMSWSSRRLTLREGRKNRKVEKLKPSSREEELFIL